MPPFSLSAFSGRYALNAIVQRIITSIFFSLLQPRLRWMVTQPFRQMVFTWASPAPL